MKINQISKGNKTHRKEPTVKGRYYQLKYTVKQIQYHEYHWLKTRL